MSFYFCIWGSMKKFFPVNIARNILVRLEENSIPEASEYSFTLKSMLFVLSDNLTNWTAPVQVLNPNVRSKFGRFNIVRYFDSQNPEIYALLFNIYY